MKKLSAVTTLLVLAATFAAVARAGDFAGLDADRAPSLVDGARKLSQEPQAPARPAAPVIAAAVNAQPLPDPCATMFRDYGSGTPSQFDACEVGYGGNSCLPYPGDSPEWYSCNVGYRAFTGQSGT